MNTRQNKVSKQIQKDMAEIIREHSPVSGIMYTITQVRITPDLGNARIYISVFPSQKAAEHIQTLNSRVSIFKNALGRKLRHQLKKIPEILFCLDDSLDYLDKIENLLNQ